MNTLVDALSVATVVGSGVVTGILLVFSNTVMSSLASHSQGAAIMVTINERILNPTFFLLFMGTALACAALAVLTLLGHGAGGPLTLIGCALYVAGVFGVTAAVNVPMNERLAALAPGTREAEAYWDLYLERWTRWNTVRSVLGMVGTALLAAAPVAAPAEAQAGAGGQTGMQEATALPNLPGPPGSESTVERDRGGENAMSTDAQNLVRRLFEAINRQEYDALQDLVDPSYVYRTPGEELRGLAALEGLMRAYRQGFPDLELVIEDMFGAEDRVATTFTFNGTHRGELLGVPATGRRVTIQGVIHSRMEDGRLVEEWELLDLATMYQQLGLADGKRGGAAGGGGGPTTTASWGPSAPFLQGAGGVAFPGPGRTTRSSRTQRTQSPAIRIPSSLTMPGTATVYRPPSGIPDRRPTPGETRCRRRPSQTPDASR